MKVHFFNTPYLLYKGDSISKITSDMLTATPHCVGSTYNKNVFVYHCLYDFDRHTGVYL